MLISIIIPNYNRENTIIESVQSVLNQTYTDLEVIVVDDCSTDSSVKKLESIQDDRLKVYSLSENRGANYARNFGIENSNGELIAFQDSDDIWINSKLKLQLHFLKKYDADIVGCAFYYSIKFDTDIKARSKGPSNSPNVSKIVTFKDIFPSNILSTQTLLIKKEVFDQVIFDNILPRFQDWDFIINSLNHSFKIYYLDKPLVHVIRQEDSISNNNKKGIQALDLIDFKYSKSDFYSKYLRKTIFLQKSFLFINKPFESLLYFLKSINLVYPIKFTKMYLKTIINSSIN